MGNSNANRIDSQRRPTWERRELEAHTMKTVKCPVILPGKTEEQKDLCENDTGQDLKDCIQGNTTDYVVVLCLSGNEEYILGDNEELGDRLGRVEKIKIVSRNTAKSQPAQLDDLQPSVKLKKKD